ncbi:MAG: TetR/AcrR family transcriptional regulator [Caulobacteraceae bacterium]|nr:TetR/AcrR family transcriptional regulator [Caulobacteraceae bacterium]
MKHQPIQPVPDQAAGMTRRALAKMRTRQRLLGAARRLFTTRGYEAATIRDIAAEADLSTGAVFASFSDKADLFNEVIIADCEALFQEMAEVGNEGAPTDILLRLLSHGYAMHLEHLPLTKAALGFSWIRNLDQETRYRRSWRVILNRLSAVLAQGVERGELSSDLDIPLTSEMILDAYLANFRRAIFDGWDVVRLQERLRSQITVLLAGYQAAA